LQVTIRDGNFTDLDGLEPTITWENSAFVNDINIRVSFIVARVHTSFMLRRHQLILHASSNVTSHIIFHASSNTISTA
jgi:hypothetical protein